MNIEKIAVQSVVCGYCSTMITVTARHSPSRPPQGLLYVGGAECPCGKTTINFQDTVLASDIRVRARRVKIKPFAVMTVRGGEA